jgi:hypothetical protein
MLRRAVPDPVSPVGSTMPAVAFGSTFLIKILNLMFILLNIYICNHGCWNLPFLPFFSGIGFDGTNLFAVRTISLYNSMY